MDDVSKQNAAREQAETVKSSEKVSENQAHKNADNTGKSEGEVEGAAEKVQEVDTPKNTESPENICNEDDGKKALESELAQVKDRLLRLGAEFENFKRISQREQSTRLKFANEALIEGLLPIIDNLEHAVNAAKKSNSDAEDLRVGIELVLKQFSDTLKKFGVEIFSAVGKPFDPSRHEAVSEQIDDTVSEGTVVVEYQKGYLLHERLLRPARVAVSKKSGN